MSVREILSLISLVWSIVRELIAFYKHLEEKYKWGRFKGPVVKQEIRQRKREEFDGKLVELFKAKSLPEPDRNTQAYVRELVHKKLSKKATLPLGVRRNRWDG